MEAHRIRRRKRARKEEEKPEKITFKEISAHNIPHEIMREILLRLPAKSLSRFKTVSKSWRALISNPQFVKSHLKFANKCDLVSYCHISDFNGLESPHQTVSLTSINREASETETVKLKYPFNYQSDSVTILGSCDGLLLIGIWSITLLWNPTAGEYITLARNCWESDGCDVNISGLGYDSSVNEYKAVLFVVEDDDFDEDDIYEEHMYLCSTSRSTRYGEWKNVDGVNEFPYGIGNSNRLGITVNGAPHWVVSDSKVNHFSPKRTIIYFDMAEEKFKRLPTPNSWCNGTPSIISISVLGECLCTTLYYATNGRYDVWSMKEYGVKESCTKLFAIQMHSVRTLMPLGFTKKGDEVVLQINRNKLVAYNLNTKRDKFIGSTTEEFCTYVESLISIGFYGEKKHMMRRRMK